MRLLFRISVMAVVLGLLGGCGDDDGIASDTTSGPTDTSVASEDTSDTTGGIQSERERAALPAGGPVDEVFPPGDRPYDRLANGECAELLADVDAWEAQGVGQVEGQDTVALYRSAAHACLGEWDAAIDAFDAVSGVDSSEPNCARTQVYEWLRQLIDQRQTDPSFDPEFVPSEQNPSLCPDEPTVESTDEPTDTPGEQPDGGDVSEDSDTSSNGGTTEPDGGDDDGG